MPVQQKLHPVWEAEAWIGWAELVWRREVLIGGARITNPTVCWLAASPNEPIIHRKGSNVAHDGLTLQAAAIGPGTGGVGDAVRGGSWCQRHHLVGENGKKSIERS